MIANAMIAEVQERAAWCHRAARAADRPAFAAFWQERAAAHAERARGWFAEAQKASA